MKGILDWKSKEVVNIYDEVSFWSAPFGKILLENIPMKPFAQVLDIGFGTGFPLIELSQRFGNSSNIYGIDLWDEAIVRTKEKIRVLGLANIKIFEQSAENIPLPDNSIDLICSNLGLNNFENKNRVIQECHRVLKSNGHLCISTNPKGTFHELFTAFKFVINNLDLKGSSQKLNGYIEHRDTKESLKLLFQKKGFVLNKFKEDSTDIRFTNAQAVFDYALIRIGFLEYWNTIIPKEKHQIFYEHLKNIIENTIKTKGEFKMSIPIYYLEFVKK